MGVCLIEKERAAGSPITQNLNSPLTARAVSGGFEWWV
jgi:hypothetical protein